jgi:rare lipoprotein A
MRLPNNAPGRAFVLLGLTATLGACALIPGGGGRVASIDRTPAAAPFGPQADYPMVLGDAFTVDGQEYVPADTASYDAVGYAALDADGGQGISVAHKTLPLPSYVEITSLETGRTILARVERRGPMTGSRLVALSRAAQAQLGSGDGTPVRVRRVNPMEAERAELRAGRAVAERMETPKSLLAVLARKLPDSTAAPVQVAAASVTEPARIEPVNFDRAFTERREASAAYPLESSTVAASTPALPPVAAPVAVAAAGDFVIQAAAFSSEANAARAADAIGGFVTHSGKYYRVRTGPYATRGQAEAALAKVRAAGYSDARVFTAG